MPTQSKTWQLKYIEDRRRSGWPDHFWYVEATYNRGMSMAPAVYPAAPWVPAVPFGADPAASRRVAAMLAALFAGQVKNHEFEPQITTGAVFNAKGSKWYTIDKAAPHCYEAVCEQCGAVESVPYTELELEAVAWLCAACSTALLEPRRPPRRRRRVSTARSDGLLPAAEELARWWDLSSIPVSEEQSDG